jgi:hypothetical protein
MRYAGEATMKTLPAPSVLWNRNSPRHRRVIRYTPAFIGGLGEAATGGEAVMKRLGVFALLGVIAAANGCASPARVVSYNREDGSGVVAIPDRSDAWPNYNYRAARALIEKQVGPNYKIISEGEVVVGQSTQNQQQTNTEQTANRRNPNLPGERQTTTGSVTQQNVTEYRITFARVAAPANYDQPAGGLPGGITPAGGIARTQQGPPPGTVPSPLPVGAGGGFR